MKYAQVTMDQFLIWILSYGYTGRWWAGVIPAVFYFGFLYLDIKQEKKPLIIVKLLKPKRKKRKVKQKAAIIKLVKNASNQ